MRVLMASSPSCQSAWKPTQPAERPSGAVMVKMVTMRSPGAMDAGSPSPSEAVQPFGRAVWIDSPFMGLSNVFSKNTPTWALLPGVKEVMREILSG